jgi:hypothetical protein
MARVELARSEEGISKLTRFLFAGRAREPGGAGEDPSCLNCLPCDAVSNDPYGPLMALDDRPRLG